VGRRAQGLVAAALLLAAAGTRAPAEEKDDANALRDVDWFAARGKAAVEPLIRSVAQHDELGPFADAVYFAIGAEAVEVARELLASDDPHVRAAAARALGAAGPAATGEVDALVARLDDDNAGVRRAAARALGQLGRVALPAVTVLVEKLQDGDAFVLRALGAIVRDASFHAHRGRARAGPEAEEADRAVARGLAWLARHQDADGKWHPARFDRHAPAHDRNGGYGQSSYVVGVTGLALLAFLHAGPPDRYRIAVRRAARYLVGRQQPDGLFGRPDYQNRHYNHAIATWALAEVWRRTRAPRYLDAARRGARYLERARNPDMAWRYEPRGGDNDTSVTAWATHALRAAELAGVRVDPEAYAGALKWIDAMTHEATGRAGYESKGGGSARPKRYLTTHPAAMTRSSTAAAVVARLAAGRTYAGDELLRKGVWECAKLPPLWDAANGRVDPYYWFHGTLAMYYTRCRAWPDWRKALLAALLRNQYKTRAGQRAGSWDPGGPWKDDGGRVYTTAILVLALQCFTRELPPLAVPVAREPGCHEAVELLRRLRDDDTAPPDRRDAARGALVGLD